MFKQTKEAIKEQKKTRPKIETFASEYLDGTLKDNVLEFIADLREMKMNPSYAGILNAWTLSHTGKLLARIQFYNDECKWVNKRTWSVSLYLNNLHMYEDVIISEGIQNVLWDNIRGYCTDGCKSTKAPIRPCHPGKTLTLAGKEFKRVCVCYPHIWIWDADKAMLSNIKRLLELEKQARVAK